MIKKVISNLLVTAVFCALAPLANADSSADQALPKVAKECNCNCSKHKHKHKHKHNDACKCAGKTDESSTAGSTADQKK